MLLYSPRWLFFYPGLALLILGLGLGAAIVPGPLVINGVTLDVDSLAVAAAMVVIGTQAVMFALFTSVYASNEGFLPSSAAVRKLLRSWTLERGLLAGTAVGLLGLGGVITSVVWWSSRGFGHLDYDAMLRIVLPSASALTMSCQLILGTFFLSILSIRRAGHAVADEFLDDHLPADGEHALGPVGRHVRQPVSESA